MTRGRADAVLDSIEAQVERVKNNGARRRLRKALSKAKAKRALTLEIERLGATRAAGLRGKTISEIIVDAPALLLALPADGGPHVQVYRSAHPPHPDDALVRVEHVEAVR